MMDLSKKYIEKGLNESIEVNISNDDGTFYTLNNGVKILKDVFEKRFEESKTIDASTFFNTTSDLGTQLFNIDTSKINDSNISTEPVIKSVGVDQTERVKREGNDFLNKIQSNISDESGFLKNQSNTNNIPNNTNTDVSKYKVHDNENDIDVDRFLGISKPPVQPVQPVQQTIQVNNLSINDLNNSTIINNQPQNIMDPSEMMFKMFKANFDVNIKLDFDSKIANPEFIKMMRENFESDIIEYYTKSIVEKILADPEHIKNVVYDQLSLIIDGVKPNRNPVKKTTVKKTPVKKTTKQKNTSK